MASDKVIQEYGNFQITFTELYKIYKEMTSTISLGKSDSDFEELKIRMKQQLDNLNDLL